MLFSILDVLTVSSVSSKMHKPSLPSKALDLFDNQALQALLFVFELKKKAF